MFKKNKHLKLRYIDDNTTRLVTNSETLTGILLKLSEKICKNIKITTRGSYFDINIPIMQIPESNLIEFFEKIYKKEVELNEGKSLD